MSNNSTSNSFFKVLDSLGRYVEMSSGFICVLLFAGMTMVALLGILFRYVMVNPFEWTEEVARFLMLMICFLAINIGLRRKEHIAITSIVDLFPKSIAKLLDYCSDVLIMFFLVILLKQGYGMSTGTLMTASTIEISMTWIYMFVPIGALLTIIQLVIRFVEKLFSDLGIAG